jgi:hypothetical protein
MRDRGINDKLVPGYGGHRVLIDANKGGREFCFVIGLPRSGTTVFKDMLQTHPLVFNMGEVFSEPNGRSYFHFLQKLVDADRDALFPSRAERNFIGYLEWCREQAQANRPGSKIIVLDVKYDQTQLLVDPWRSLGSLPRIFSLMRDRSWRVIDIHRNEILDQIVSNRVAIKTKIYHSDKQTRAEGAMVKVRLDPKQLRREINWALNSYHAVSQHFKDYDGYMMVSYEEMFDADGDFSASLTENLSAFLGLENKFDRKPKLVKLLDSNVYSHIENDIEIREFVDRWKRNKRS